MNLDIELPQALGGILPRNKLNHPRVYPDVAPMGSESDLPYITWTTVGGQSVTTFCGNEPRNARIQFNVWARSRLEANATMRAVAAILTAPPYRAVSLGEPTAEYDPITKDRGARQDLSFWYTPTDT